MRIFLILCSFCFSFHLLAKDPRVNLYCAVLDKRGNFYDESSAPEDEFDIQIKDVKFILYTKKKDTVTVGITDEGNQLVMEKMITVTAWLNIRENKDVLFIKIEDSSNSRLYRRGIEKKHEFLLETANHMYNCFQTLN
jgi:predicted RNase H-related nuclease YkuK (DUF458 family)